MTERQSARMSKIKNGGLDQYGAEPFKKQQFRTVGIEGVKVSYMYAIAEDGNKTRVCQCNSPVTIP